MDTVKKGDHLLSIQTGVEVIVVAVDKAINTLTLKRYKIPNAVAIDYDLDIANRLWVKVTK